MIISTPLNLPKLVPSDWDKWFSIWSQHGQQLKKTRGNHNSMSGLHFGFDVYKHERALTDYDAVKIDMESLWPEFYQELMDMIPVEPYVVRFVMSTGDFPAHTDNAFRNWQLRSLFYHPDPNPQWYFTDLDGERKEFLRMPEQTNWFAYLDGACKHGTHYNPEHPKILLQIFSHAFTTKKYVETQLNIDSLDKFRIAY